MAVKESGFANQIKHHRHRMSGDISNAVFRKIAEPDSTLGAGVNIDDIITDAIADDCFAVGQLVKKGAVDSKIVVTDTVGILGTGDYFLFRFAFGQNTFDIMFCQQLLFLVEVRVRKGVTSSITNFFIVKDSLCIVRL